MTPELGVVFVPQLTPERLRSAVQTADAVGLSQVWLWEDCFLQSGIASAAAALAWTERVRIGVGLLPVPLRNVALTAMEIATLERLFPGRFQPAVGHGVQDWMAQVGARVESPVSLLREYTVALRALLAGERVTTSGRYVHLDDVALDWPPAIPTPVYAGAVGPRSLRLCGEVADGIVISGGTSPQAMRSALTEVRVGRTTAGKAGDQPVVVYLIAVTGPEADARLRRELQRWSLDPADDVAVAGEAAVVAAAARRWADAGASTVVLQPPADEPDVDAYIRFVAEQVAPLV